MIESIHGLMVKEAIRGKHDPVCSITATAAYEQWWRAAYCSREYVSNAIQINSDAEKKCQVSQTIGTSAQVSPGSCKKSEVLQAIESMAQGRAQLAAPVEGQYQCSAKWKDLAKEISDQYYKQYGSMGCQDAATVDAALKKIYGTAQVSSGKKDTNCLQ